MNEFSNQYSPRSWRSFFGTSAICLAVVVLLSGCSSLTNRQSLFSSQEKEAPKEESVPKAQYDQLLVKYEHLMERSKRLEKQAQNSILIEGDNPADVVENLSKAAPTTELAETVDVFAPPPKPKGISRKGTAAPSIHMDMPIAPDNLENSIVDLRKARRLVAQNKFNDAMSILKELENSGHRQVMVRAKFLIGDILYKQGNYDLAMQVYEEIITNYAFSGVVLDTLRRLTICSEKLKLSKKKEKYFSMLHDFF